MTDTRQEIENKINKYLALHFALHSIGYGLPEDEYKQEAEYVVDLVIQWLAQKGE